MTSLSEKDIEENHWFGNGNRINSVNFNATTLKFAERFGNLFSRLFIWQNIFAQGHGFDAETVKTSKYFVSLN